jgi:4-alpha-glucanotransferase
LHPQSLRTSHYRYVIDYLRFQMRHADMLRIDHVMGLHRLFWIPHSLPRGQGAYVTYPAEELYAIINLESHRQRTVVVGENLGTVPPAVNSRLGRHRIRKMFVLQYEQRPDPHSPVSSPPRLCVASLNTHDMPTFAAHWQGLDILDRQRLGYLKQRDVKIEQRARRKLNLALSRFLRRQGYVNRRAKFPPAAVALLACLRYLSASQAETVLINLEDLWLETLPQNVPGTSTECPNWRRKARYSLEQIRQWVGSRGLLECVAQRNARSGR